METLPLTSSNGVWGEFAMEMQRKIFENESVQV